jgi:ATP-dependent Clp endopeptidase proteolytic subunit ClpP
MSKTNLFRPQAFEAPDGMSWDAPSQAITRWAEVPQAAASTGNATIDIYDFIGSDPWTGGGFNAKRMSAALRSIGENDVVVNVNSPGGDMFEGLAMYNMLADHKGAVTVKVVGLAASAASIIAMAGDEVQMGLGSFLMIHNAWGAVIGNQNDMRTAADTFAQFDTAMGEIYAHKTGLDIKAIAKMMDAETFMSASDAVSKGFATGTFEQAKQTEGEAKASASLSAYRRLDATLAQSGMPRSERRKLLREAVGTHDAAETVTPGADFDTALAAQLLQSFKS